MSHFSPKGRRRLLALAALTTGAALALAGCTSTPEPSPGTVENRSEELTPIAITVADTGSGQKVLAALGDGWFEQYGLEVTATRLGNGGEVLAAIEGGSVDIGYADLLAGINAISNGFDIRLVVSNNHHATDIPWLVKADSTIEDPKDLAGKKIGISPVPQHTISVRGFLEANDVDPDSVELVELRDLAALPEALQSGTVDAIYSNYPVLFRNQGQPEAFDFRAIGDGSTASYASPTATTAAFWAGGQWAESEEGAEASQRFADALRAYNRWLVVDATTEEKVAHILKYTEVDYDAIAGGDPGKLELLLDPVELYEPIDIDATLDWYETGQRLAPNKVTGGVDFVPFILDAANG